MYRYVQSHDCIMTDEYIHNTYTNPERWIGISFPLHILEAYMLGDITPYKCRFGLYHITFVTGLFSGLKKEARDKMLKDSGLDGIVEKIGDLWLK